MEAIELIELIGRGEDSQTQFKQNFANAESLAGELVAFSNSKGGKILLGVNDMGAVTGITAEDIRRLNQLVSNTATNLVRPSINPITENITTASGDLVMVVHVAEGISKPYSDNAGVFWVKSGSDKRRVTSREEIQRLFQSASLVYADEVPVEGTTSADIEMDHFRDFFQRVYGAPLDAVLERDGISFGQLLQNLGLAQDGKLRLGGLLLFGRMPHVYRPAFIGKGVSFLGNDAAGNQYRDSDDFKGSLRDLYKSILSFLTRNLVRVQGGKNFNTLGDLEIPVNALEELVVNMLLHRDYFVSAPVRIFIFDNRIELISPGALPNSLTIANIRSGVSVIRNPLLVSFGTKELPYRGIGTGIRRALSAVPNLEFESDHDRNLFTVTIPRTAAAI